MKKEVIKHSKVVEYYCDLCDSKITNRTYHCRMCGRELCFNCKVEDFSDNMWNDYPDYYCIHCWKIGNPYKDAIRQESLRHDKEVERLEKEWKDKCHEFYKGQDT